MWRRGAHALKLLRDISELDCARSQVRWAMSGIDRRKRTRKRRSLDTFISELAAEEFDNDLAPFTFSRVKAGIPEALLPYQDEIEDFVNSDFVLREACTNTPQEFLSNMEFLKLIAPSVNPVRFHDIINTNAAGFNTDIQKLRKGVKWIGTFYEGLNTVTFGEKKLIKVYNVGNYMQIVEHGVQVVNETTWSDREFENGVKMASILLPDWFKIMDDHTKSNLFPFYGEPNNFANLVMHHEKLFPRIIALCNCKTWNTYVDIMEYFNLLCAFENAMFEQFVAHYDDFPKFVGSLNLEIPKGAFGKIVHVFRKEWGSEIRSGVGYEHFTEKIMHLNEIGKLKLHSGV